MKDIKNYEGLYAVTSCGRVWSYKSNKFLSLGKDTSGYLFIKLYKNGKGKYFRINRLVAMAYIPNPSNLDTVDHIDNNKENNSVNNLQWLSNADNIRKAQSKKVMCVETQKIFESAVAAARELGLYNSGISRCSNGKLKTCGGYHWKYVE